MNITWRSLLVAGLALAATAGCGADRPELTPAPGAQSPEGLPDTAATEVQGLNVAVHGGAWPGEVPIDEAVTPLRITLRNEGDRPIRVRYRELVLVGADGKRYAAIPPVKIDAEVEVPRLAPGHPVIDRPMFEADRFEAAPFYRPMYPTLGIYNQPFAFDPRYNDTWYEYWTDIELPTPEMVARALPEGVLAPGGRVSGFVYFEHIDPDDVSRVRFRADVVDARTGEILGVAEIPLVVEQAEPATEY